MLPRASGLAWRSIGAVAQRLPRRHEMHVDGFRIVAGG